MIVVDGFRSFLSSSNRRSLKFSLLDKDDYDLEGETYVIPLSCVTCSVLVLETGDNLDQVRPADSLIGT